MNNRQSAKKDLRRRPLAWFRSRIRSTSPSSRTTTSPPATTPGPTSQVSSSTHNTFLPTPQQAVGRSQDPLLQATLRRLSEISRDDHAAIQKSLASPQDADNALDQALAAAQAQQRQHLKESWTFTFNGRSYTAREKVDKVVQWLNRFKAAGDIAVNADPVHAGLPWAGIRILLEAVTSDANQRAALLVGCEVALYLGNRLKVYTDFLRLLSPTQARDNFETALVELYACILRFLGQAVRLYQTSTSHRVFQTLWKENEVGKFEDECSKLARRAEDEARNCDRIRFEEFVQTHIREIAMLRQSFDRIEMKIDLAKIPHVKSAEFDAREVNCELCHSGTRVDVLDQIQDWARQPNGKSILWLNGKAGTGKSTVAYTTAEWLSRRERHEALSLGASFFFKRGAGDRGSALLFFPTIVRQMARKVQGLDIHLAAAIDSNPDIGTKRLGEQFDRMIFEPLQKLRVDRSCAPPVIVVVVDALDECEDDADIGSIIGLWPRLAQITSVRLKLFLTSRPDIPIRDGFGQMSINLHLDMDLENSNFIRHDIYTFLKDKFSSIQKNDGMSDVSPSLGPDWPGEQVLQDLTTIAVPLFIVAATICRFVKDPHYDPRDQLNLVLESQGGGGEQMEQTYLPVLNLFSSSISDEREKDSLHQDFRDIIGSIILLGEPLSVLSLASILVRPADQIARRLRFFHSVLQIPSDRGSPVQTLHLSFREFLLSDRLAGQPYQIHSPSTHEMLLKQCLHLLSKSQGHLRADICRLGHPGYLRHSIDSDKVETCLPAPVQYACQYWVYHAQESRVKIQDDHLVYHFLREHFLHWFEALSILGKSTSLISYIRDLQSLLAVHGAKLLSTFLEDARRFTLSHRYIGDLAPLQLYYSAIVFSPQTSLVRGICGQAPSWIQQLPSTPQSWSPELQKLEGHATNVNAVAFSPNGQLLASASDDRTVRLWEVNTGQEVQKLEDPTDKVQMVVFSPDGQLLASASRDGTVRLWDVSTGQEAQKLEGKATTVAFSPALDSQLLALALRDRTVRIWETTTRQEVQKLEGHTTTVKTVAFSPNNRLLASASRDHTVRLWEVSTGREVQKLKSHNSDIVAMSFSPDSQLLALVSYGSMIELWEASTGQKVQKLEAHNTTVSTVAFSPKGQLLASASWDHTIKLWDVNTWQEVQKLEGHTGAIDMVAFSPDGQLLASASSDYTVRLWEICAGQEVQEFESHTRGIKTVVFSPDGQLLASTSGDDIVRLWEVSKGQEVQKLEGHTGRVYGVAFSPSGQLLASASYDRTARIWEVSTGQEVQKLEGHIRRVTDVVFSPDGQLLATVSYDETVRLWKVSTGQETHKLMSHVSGRRVMTFSPDSQLLASAPYSTTVELWEVSTGQMVQRLGLYSRNANAVTFSPNGQLLASASRDHSVRLWEVSTGQKVQELQGHNRTVIAMSLSPDGRLLASASDDGTVRLWDVSAGLKLQQFKLPHVTKITFSDDYMALLTDRGPLILDEKLALRPSDTLVANQRLQGQDCITLNNEWIQHNGRNLLWLPHEYRSLTSAVHGNTIAIGQDSGRLSFIQLDSSRLPPLPERIGHDEAAQTLLNAGGSVNA